MNRVLCVFFFSLLWGCNDGDLQIETIDFDDMPIQTCETTITVNSNLFFKINASEALILELQSGLLKNEVSQDTVISTVPGQSNLIYRIFSGTVTKNYFCDAIPLTEPTVLEEIEATNGEVRISTIQNPADSTQFQHTIELSNITLINEQGERITDTRINAFGTVTTSQ